MVYSTGGRATRGITVEITDEAGKPVPDVSVSFRLPDEGPSGTFNTGARTEVVTTRQDGRATVWGMKWNKTPGTLEVRITAVKSGIRAGIVSIQHLTDTPVAMRERIGVASGGHSKLLLVALIAAGAAGGGIAMGLARNSRTAATVTPTIPLSIGTPSVIVGAP